MNDPFYPLIKSRCPQAGPGVNTVTIVNLLTMKSGMVVDGTLNVTDLWAFLTQYLQQGLVGTPGVTEAYSNTNFTILQAIIAILADPGNNGGNGIDPSVKYVSNNVLAPMGIDTNDFNAVPDPAGTSTLTYSANDSRQGQYWGVLDCVGPGCGDPGEQLGLRHHRADGRRLRTAGVGEVASSASRQRTIRRAGRASDILNRDQFRRDPDRAPRRRSKCPAWDRNPCPTVRRH